MTHRQREVFDLMGEGLSTKQIAARLGISIKTVNAHLERIKLACGVYSIDAVKLAAWKAVQCSRCERKASA